MFSKQLDIYLRIPGERSGVVSYHIHSEQSLGSR